MRRLASAFSSVAASAHGRLPSAPEQSTSTSSPSAGSPSGNAHAHHARHLELAADDADVAARRAARADHGGELVVDRGQEGGAGVPHERRRRRRRPCPSGQHVVGAVQRRQRPRTGAWSNTFAPSPISLHGRPILTAMARYLSPEWIDELDRAAAASDRSRASAPATSQLAVQQRVTGGPDGDVAYHVELDEGAWPCGRARRAPTTSVRAGPRDGGGGAPPAS